MWTLRDGYRASIVTKHTLMRRVCIDTIEWCIRVDQRIAMLALLVVIVNIVADNLSIRVAEDVT